eukprot:3138336-Prymnesium_polylepis.1
MEVAFVYVPSLVGSVGFTFASYVCAPRFTAREQSSRSDPMRVPLQPAWAIAVCWCLSGKALRCADLMEVTHSANPFRPPEALTVGYMIALLYLAGSLLYTIACCFYFVPESEEDEPLSGSMALLDEGEAPFDASYYYSEWGVRFLFGIGSICFVVGAALSFPEILSD